jgi:translocation and assembly module TamB
VTVKGPDPTESDPSVGEPGPAIGPLARTLRRAMRWGVRTVAGGSLLGLLLVGILQFDGVSTWLAARLANRLNPYPGTQLTVERASGSWIRSLRLDGVRLTSLQGREAAGPEVVLDSLEVHFRFLPLLLRRVEILEAEVMGLRAELTQRPDSIWDFLAPFQRTDEPNRPEEGGSRIRFRSGPIRVNGGTSRVVFAPEGPSAAPDRLEIEELSLVVANLEVGNGGLVVGLDNMFARFLPPGEALDRVVVEGKGTVANGRVVIPGFTLRSGASDVSAQGTLLLPQGEEGEVEEVDFHFQANPVAFRDLSGFVRTLDPRVSAEADLRLHGSASRMDVSGRATLSDGSRLGLEGTFTPSAQGPVEYRLEGTFEDLRLRSFLGESWAGGTLNAHLSAELEGSRLAQLNGDVSAWVEGLQLHGREARPLAVSGGFLDGQADLDLEWGLDGLGAVELSVGGRPLDSEPTLLVRGTYRKNGPPAYPTPTLPGEPTLDLPEQPRAWEVESRFSFETRGFSVDSAMAELEMETLQGAYQGLSLEGGSLRATWTGGEGTVEINQPLGAGHVDATGELTWMGDDLAGGKNDRILRFSVPDLELRELDLHRLLGDTVPSRVNAGVTMEGAGTDLGTLEADVLVRMQESEFGGVALDSAVARARLQGGSVSALVEGWQNGSDAKSGPPTGDGGQEAAPGGWVTATLQGRLFGAEPFLVLDSLQFSGIDLTSMAGLPSHLNGMARGRMVGLDFRTGDLSGELHLLPSRIRSTPVDSGTVAVSLSTGALQITGQLSSPEGTLVLRGGASPFADPLTFQVDEGEVRDLNLGPLLGRQGLHSAINVDLELQGSGSSLQDLEAVSKVAVLPSTLNRGRVQGGSLELEAHGRQGRLLGEIHTPGGEVSLQGLAALGRGLEEVRIEGDIDLADLGTFIDRTETDLSARGKVGATWTPENGLVFSSDLEGRIGEASIDTFSVSGSFEDSALRLDTLRVVSDLLRANGGGSLALGEGRGRAAEWDLSVTADLLDLSALAPLVGLEELSTESGRIEFEAKGPPGDPSLEAFLELGPWLINGVSGDSAVIRAHRGSDEITLASQIQALRGRGSLDMALRANPGPDEKRGTLERLNISVPEAEWSLESQVPFSWKSGLQVDDLALASHQGRISLDGRLDRRGTQDLTLTFEQATLTGVLRLFGLGDVDLLAHGRIALTGAADSPVAEGELQLDLAVPEGGSVSADTRFSLVDSRLAMDIQALDRAGAPLTLEGTLPMAFSLAPVEDTASPASSLADQDSVDLTIRTQTFDISWVGALIPGGAIEVTAGQLSVDARASGPVDQPVLEGRIGLENGQVRFAALGTAYEDIDLSAELRDQSIRIGRARLTSGPGTAEIQGIIAVEGFRPQDLDLTARTDRFLAANTPTVGATITGDLNLRGSIQEPRVAGNLNLEGSELRLDDISLGSEVQAVELTEEDYRMLEDYFGYRIEERGGGSSDFVERLGLDLVVSFGQDVWINRSGKLRVALEVRGDLELEKDPMGDYRVIGTVETLPERSYFRQFGRRFSVQEGELTLTGDPAEFLLHMDAQWEVPSHSNPDEAEVVVNLGVDGDAESLELTLSSEPTMDEADIVSYLATGKPQSALASLEDDASSLAASMAMGAMAGVLEGMASEAVKLDVMEVQLDPVRGTTLIAGRYVSPNLYLGFRQPVTFSEGSSRTRTENQESEVELEYRWFQWLTVNVRGGASELGLFLRARYVH